MEGVQLVKEIAEYRAKYKLDEVLATAIASARASNTKNPYAFIANVLSDMVPPEEAKAPGFDQQVNADNLGKAVLGVLKHKAPNFSYFDPQKVEKESVVMKEVKLPFADQTHEVCFDPVTQCVFVSQMSSSVLVRIPVCPQTGLLLDDQDAWTVGETDENGVGIGGLHNVSLSHAHPGCIWISLQFENTVVLIDGKTMSARAVLRTPTHYKEATTGEIVRIGGPHCVRECKTTGDVWIALKGAISCHPKPPSKEEDVAGSDARLKRLSAVMKRVCCSPDALSKYMADINQREGFDCPPPDGYAVWRISMEKYDPSKPDKGGNVYPCLPSPPMLALDRRGNCWVAQDQSTSIMRIDAATHECTQIQVPMDNSDGHEMLQLTGPAIGTAPNGNIWCTLLGHGATLCIVNPETNDIAIHKLYVPPWANVHRLIHFEFDPSARDVYLLSSDLLDDAASNAILKLHFDFDWENVVSMRIKPLPTQDCACHRICLAHTSSGGHPSVVVSEMETSKLFQALIENVGHDFEISSEFVDMNSFRKCLHRRETKE